MSNPRSTVLTGVLIWCSCASFALAVDTSWNAGVSDWSNPSNWSAGEPNQVNRAVISNGGTALIGTGEETNGMIVGWNAGQSGAIRIEDETDSLTSFGVNAVVRIGFNGSGSAFHSAGSFVAGSDASETNTLTVGPDGLYELSGTGQLTVFGTVNVEGSFTQSGGTHLVSTRTGVANTGRLFMYNASTYNLTGGLLAIRGSASIGSDSDAHLIIDGAAAVLDATNNAAPNGVSFTVGTGGATLIELKQGTVTIDGNFNVGHGNVGVVTQTGGSLTSTSGNVPLHLGTASGGNGTYNLYGGTLSLRNGPLGRDLVLGNLANTSGTFNIGDATGRGSLVENTSAGADVIVRRDAASSGTFRGWSDDGVTNSISLTGTFTNNGQVIADGYGVDRSLNLTSFVASNPIRNGIENGVNEGHGWFAQDHGKLVLPTITVPAGSAVNWGENAADADIDLINSVRLTTAGVSAGTLSIALLATDRDDVSAAVADLAYRPLSLFEFTPGTFGFGAGSLTVQVRYDHTALLPEDHESELQLLLYDGSAWLNITSNVNLGTRTITSEGISSFGGGLIAVAGALLPVPVIPEPGTLSLFFVCGGALLRRNRQTHS